MPLIFLVILDNYSAGMSLYMVVSTLASVIQTKMTKNLHDPAAPTTPAGPAVNPVLTPVSKSKK
jgi:membrane protein insertase Oxa1/YidC/SpoIIIJ